MHGDPRYDSPRWRALRDAVRRRDGQTCMRCGARRVASSRGGGLRRGAKGEPLDVHHRIPVRDGGDFWGMDNLITLCRGCHVRVHVRLDRAKTESPAAARWRRLAEEPL